MLDGSEFFECQCGSDEHTLRFVYDKENNEFYLSIFLDNYRPWWKRLGLSIKYLFGYKSRYGHFGEWLMEQEDASRLSIMLDKVIKN